MGRPIELIYPPARSGAHRPRQTSIPVANCAESRKFNSINELAQAHAGWTLLPKTIDRGLIAHREGGEYAGLATTRTIEGGEHAGRAIAWSIGSSQHADLAAA